MATEGVLCCSIHVDVVDVDVHADVVDVDVVHVELPLPLACATAWLACATAWLACATAWIAVGYMHIFIQADTS